MSTNCVRNVVCKADRCRHINSLFKEIHLLPDHINNDVINNIGKYYYNPFFVVALRPNAGHGLLILEVF